MEESPLLDALTAIVPSGGIAAEEPDIMEAYNQRCAHALPDLKVC